MATIKSRVNSVGTLRPDFIKAKDMEIEKFDNVPEIKASKISTTLLRSAVLYLARWQNGMDKRVAFKPAIDGADRCGKRETAEHLLNLITKFDDASIKSAVQLATFDVWINNAHSAGEAVRWCDVEVDETACNNIRTLIDRTVDFFYIYGPITVDRFDFMPINPDMDDYMAMLAGGSKSYGGYTKEVGGGWGDFLTGDTIWDFTCSKANPTSKDIMCIVVKYIMGKHCGRYEFHNIKNIGIFNPVLNNVYTYDMTKLNLEIIKEIEDKILCY